MKPSVYALACSGAAKKSSKLDAVSLRIQSIAQSCKREATAGGVSNMHNPGYLRCMIDK